MVNNIFLSNLYTILMVSIQRPNGFPIGYHVCLFLSVCLFQMGQLARNKKTDFVTYADNKGAYLIAHTRSLISAFVLRFL